MRKFITKRRVLKWINEYRLQELNWPSLKSIPKGRRCGSCDCPIAIASGGIVDGTLIYDSPAMMDDAYEMPEFVRQFVNDFDEGKYPELELNG